MFTFYYKYDLAGYSYIRFNYLKYHGEKQSFTDVLQNRRSYKNHKFHRKTSVLESLFIKLQAFKPVILLKRDSNTGVLL